MIEYHESIFSHFIKLNIICIHSRKVYFERIIFQNIYNVTHKVLVMGAKINLNRPWPKFEHNTIHLHYNCMSTFETFFLCNIVIMASYFTLDKLQLQTLGFVSAFRYDMQFLVTWMFLQHHRTFSLNTRESLKPFPSPSMLSCMTTFKGQRSYCHRGPCLRIFAWYLIHMLQSQRSECMPSSKMI